MEVFLNSILPLMILIAVGYFAGKIFKGDLVVFSKVTLWIFATVLTFSFINDHPITLRVLLSYGGAFFLLLGYNFLLFKIILRKNPQKDTFFLTSIFGNTGYLGYPVLGTAIGEKAIAYGVMYSVISVFTVNTLGIALIMKNIKDSLRKLFSLPFLYAIAAGLLLGYLGKNWRDFPKPIYLSLDMINKAAIPVITVFLGTSMSKIKLKAKNLLIITLASLHRLVVLPLLALVVAELFGMRGLEREVFIIESAMPTAMNAAVIASAIEENPEVVSSVVAFSTLLSSISLTFWINFVR